MHRFVQVGFLRNLLCFNCQIVPLRTGFGLFWECGIMERIGALTRII
uniref:Uncharacterized protein n=1 Tax=Rhizophora mucronata TaxID=61149 RepID=A0A2P2NPC9_RHIMU